MNQLPDEHKLKLPVAYVDIRFSVHATEDPEKIKKAAHSLFPADHITEVTFMEKVLRGYYGNRIVLFKTRIKDEEMIKAFVKKLSICLSEQDKERIFRESNLFVERGNLYLRLDKQAALEGKLELRKDDPIHIRIHFKKKKIIEICRELGIMP